MKMPVWLNSGESHLPDLQIGHLLTVLSHHREKESSGVSSSSKKVANHGGPIFTNSSKSDYFPKPQPPKTITLGIRAYIPISLPPPSREQHKDLVHNSQI